MTKKPPDYTPCLTCWINKTFGVNYPKMHTGIGPRCPR